MTGRPKATIHSRAWTPSINGYRGYDTRIEYGDGTRRYDAHDTFEAAQAHVQDLMATRHAELDQLARTAQQHTTIKARE